MKYLLIIITAIALFSCETNSESYDRGYKDATKKFQKSIMAAQEELIKLQYKSISIEKNPKLLTPEYERAKRQEVVEYMNFIAQFLKNNP